MFLLFLSFKEKQLTTTNKFKKWREMDKRTKQTTILTKLAAISSHLLQYNTKKEQQSPDSHSLIVIKITFYKLIFQYPTANKTAPATPSYTSWKPATPLHSRKAET